MMIIYEGVEFESPEEILLGNPSVNYTKQIEQKYVALLYRYHLDEIPNYIKICVENICGGQSKTGKSQFSLNANSSEIDG